MSKSGAHGSVAKALREGSSLRADVRDGVRALRGDRRLIDSSIRERFVDSIDLDAALRVEQPDEPRWDYLLGDREKLVLIAFEPHPIHSGAATAIIAKKRSAERTLRKHLRDGVRVDGWFWSTSGGGTIPKGSREERQLARAGIRFAGRRLERKHLG